MKTKPTVYIICGVFNHLEYTKKLLCCIKKQSYLKIKTIIIDDGSTDGTAEYIIQNYPEVTLLKGDGNLWWTGSIKWAVDEVLKIAQADDFILTMNNDCTFDKDYILYLLQASKKYERSIVGSLIVDQKDKNSIYDAGVKIDWAKGRFIPLGSKFLKKIKKDQLFEDELNILSTKGTLFPLEVFKKIGNFDQKHFPHYISDYELAWRAKTEGFKLILSYQAIIYNDIERTGLGKNGTEDIHLGKVWDLLFSRKSKVNIIDNLKFIQYCCPKEYKLRNYLFLLKKVFVVGSRLLFK